MDIKLENYDMSRKVNITLLLLRHHQICFLCCLMLTVILHSFSLCERAVHVHVHAVPVVIAVLEVYYDALMCYRGLHGLKQKSCASVYFNCAIMSNDYTFKGQAVMTRQHGITEVLLQSTLCAVVESSLACWLSR